MSQFDISRCLFFIISVWIGLSCCQVSPKERGSKSGCTPWTIVLVLVWSLFKIRYPKGDIVELSSAFSPPPFISFIASLTFSFLPARRWWRRSAVFPNFEPNVTAIKKRHAIERPGIGGHAHNNFLEHLASTGFMGALAFLLFTLVWLWRTYQHQQLLFPFVVSFIVSGMTQYTFGDGENLFLIMSLFALSCIPLSRGSSTYS